MRRLVTLLLIASVLLFGCARDQGPPLSVTDLAVIAPLPGRSASVAYMEMHNRSARPITIDAVSSPDFAKAEMHETVISDGIAHMQALDSVEIGARSRLRFAPGGKHIMLSDPLKGLLPGASVQLQLHYSDGGLLILDAPLQTRIDEPN